MLNKRVGIILLHQRPLLAFKQLPAYHGAQYFDVFEGYFGGFVTIGVDMHLYAGAVNPWIEPSMTSLTMPICSLSCASALTFLMFSTQACVSRLKVCNDPVKTCSGHNGENRP